jgi:phosphoglucosamine mutase
LDRLPRLRKEIRQIEHELGDEGRVLVRYSGTEKKMRVMVESVDEARIDEFVTRLESLAVQELSQ